MASGISGRDEESAGWNLDLNLSDWWDGIVNGEGERMGEPIDPRTRALQDRLDNVGWGLLFLLFGVLALPNGTAEYVSAAAVGAAMLGLNGLRIVLAVPVRWFSIVLGAAFLVGGSGAMAGVHMDVFVVFFVVAGAVTIVGALVQPARTAAK
jgi:hypothetical protein